MKNRAWLAWPLHKPCRLKLSQACDFCDFAKVQPTRKHTHPFRKVTIFEPLAGGRAAWRVGCNWDSTPNLTGLQWRRSTCGSTHAQHFVSFALVVSDTPIHHPPITTSPPDQHPRPHLHTTSSLLPSLPGRGSGPRSRFNFSPTTLVHAYRRPSLTANPAPTHNPLEFGSTPCPHQACFP